MSDTEPQKAGINPPVFFPSVIVVSLLVLFAAIMPEQANTVFSATQSWLINTFGWFYLASVGFYLVFCIFLALSRYGSFRLGPDHSEPEFSYTSWFAMLFSAGMGIGLMFYGVAEPVLHYANPPTGEGGSTPEAAKEAMRITFFHWGIHAWSIYAVVGLALAYFSFRRDLPLRISSALYPFIGKRISGPIGNVVDILAVFGTLFGVATSLAFGAQQVASGVNFLFGVPDSYLTQVVIIGVITAMATVSVVAGLDGGIRRLSEFNLYLAGALLLFVIVFGPTLYIFQTLSQNIGAYVSAIPSMTFNSYAYTGGEEAQSFMSGWTLFYWSWWISWSPFVGMFIARVSRGRTVREFLTAVLLVPTLVTVVWMATFGGSGLHQTINGIGELANGVGDSSLALFQMLAELPLTAITSFLAIVLVLVFFITSSDSGSLVIDSITAGGKLDAPVPQRVFWAIMEGLIAGALLYGGGEQALNALQAGAITTGLPFTVVLLLMCFSLYKGLSAERKLMTANT